MVNGEQLQGHVLIRLPFTFYCLPKRYALCTMRYAFFAYRLLGRSSSFNMSS
jgi:hypothetical protein